MNGVTTRYTLNGTQVIAQQTGTDAPIYFTYDANGRPYSMTYGGTTVYYLCNLSGDVFALLDADGNRIVEYTYGSFGQLLDTYGTAASTLGAINPLRYRGYYYDAETGLYYLNSRYYDPEVGRFINADGVIDPTSVLGTNLYAYCLNNPVNMSDSDGNMPKWLSGVLNVVGGIGQGFLGAALIAASPTNGGLSALAGGILMINAAGVITQGIGQIVNDATNTTILSEENIIKTGVVSIGSAIAGGRGAQVADVLYDSAIVAASVYAPAKAIKRALQQSGVIGVKVSVNKVYGNAADPFFTTSPKQGLVTSKIQSIQQTGIVDWRELQAFQKPNGYYQLNAGHHLFQALKNMGYDTVTIYLK